MSIASTIAFIPTALILPVLLVGVINRTKSLWSGRRGLPILQLGFDTIRLLRKRPVYSLVSTPIFRIGPYVVFATALASGLVVPILGQGSVLSFPFDFVWFAYVWGLGRVALILGALDTGSSFEGMGASREATFAALLEPTLFLVGGALCTASRQNSLEHAVALHLGSGATVVVWAGCVVALFILIQVESARMPVDDPMTHLELTMVHEVMILDHSGPDLAALQFGSALKMTIGISLLAALLNPWSEGHGAVSAVGASFVLCFLIAIIIGTTESLVARLKLRTVPQYILASTIAAFIAVIATSWRA